MTIDDARLRWLDDLPADRAEAELLQCCGSRQWAASMVASRPFGTGARLFERADEVWSSLAPEDWIEAFRAHPRIGERVAPSERAAATKHSADRARHERWSHEEQAGAHAASGDVNAALAQANRAYEDRFGHIFIVCATGRTAHAMLEELRARMRNSPDRELRIAADEQRRITHIRLRKLLT